jgi:predicted methyltransferase
MGKVLWVSVAAMAISAVPLAAKTPVSADYAAAVTSADRPAEDTARDADRKPAELMAFAGVRPGMKIAELSPGGGYFTRLLSGATGPQGYVYTVSGKVSPAAQAWARKHGNVSSQAIRPGEDLAPEKVDLVWTTLNYHDFKNVKVESGGDMAAAFNAAAFRALKPGGVYLVVDHQAAAGSGVSATNTLHRIEDKAVIGEVEQAGFKLAGQSTLLRHAADDHSQKVFEGAVRGKTDQFVLKFVKPR